jgi:hypothetical protein
MEEEKIEDRVLALEGEVERLWKKVEILENNIKSLLFYKA